MRKWIVTLMIAALALAFVVPVFSSHGVGAAQAQAMSHESAQAMALPSESMPMADPAGMPDDCCPGADIKHRSGHAAACDLHCLLAIPVVSWFEQLSGTDFVAPTSDAGTRLTPHFPFRPPIAA